MNEIIKQSLRYRLSYIMQEISLECWGTNWDYLLAPCIWQALQIYPNDYYYGSSTIDKKLLEEINAISIYIGEWCLLGGNDEPECIPINKWRNEFSERIHNGNYNKEEIATIMGMHTKMVGGNERI